MQVIKCTGRNAVLCGQANLTSAGTPHYTDTVWIPSNKQTQTIVALQPSQPYIVFATASGTRCGLPNYMKTLCTPIVCQTNDMVCARVAQVCECTTKVSATFRLYAKKQVRPPSIMAYSVQYMVLVEEGPDGLTPGERSQLHGFMYKGKLR